jgi:hypothetical protein
MSRMLTKLHHFLLVYSYEQGELVHQDEFTDQAKATAAYSAAEAEYRDRLDNFEIVLVGSDSIETVMRTHGHYFAQQDLAPFSTESPFQPI